VSKAFTSEEPSGAEVHGRLPVRARPGEERPITPGGYRELTERVRRLAEELLPEARRVGQGLEDVQHQLAVATATLESVRVVHPPPVFEGRVCFGATVEVRWEDGRLQRLTVVGPDEAAAGSGLLSVESPLARALLGLAAGEPFELLRPAGPASGAVLAVSVEGG
jgi:transcription elongation GreA/GreB family factor